MKKLSFLFLVFAATLIFSNCKKDAIADVEPITDSELETIFSISEETRNAIKVDLGEIGLAIDTRKLAVLGYAPAKVNVQINGALSTYSQNDLVVDEYTNLAIFKFAVQDLSEEVIDGFSDGVNLTVTVFDANGTALESRDYTNEFISSNHRSLIVDTALPSNLDPRAFNPGIPYYMIVISGPGGKELEQGAPSFLGAYTYDSTNGDDIEYSTRGNFGLTEWVENESTVYAQSQKFYFEHLENHVYRIKSEFEGAYLELNLNNDDYRLFWNKEITDPGLLDETNEFILEKTEDGFVKIKSVYASDYLLHNAYTGEITADQNVIPFDESDPGTYHLKFRFLTTGVSWNYDPQDTKYSTPIIPATTMQFGAEVTLINCGESTVANQTFGTRNEETEEISITTSENISLYGNNTSGWSATVSATAGLSFFGTGVDVTASGTLYGQSQSGFENNYSTTTTPVTGQTKEFSQELTVSVGPKSAIELYNATQIVSDVTMPFIHRIKVEGEQNGEQLTGAEIVSQIVASRFPGVITKVDTYSVVVSIRGEITVDQYFKTVSNIKEIEGACEG